jgi:hypothetical protein
MTVELARLILDASLLAGGQHPCLIHGHLWEFHGGANCGCDGGDCSVPVHRCVRCGDYDYGDNSEADTVREECEECEFRP